MKSMFFQQNGLLNLYQQHFQSHRNIAENFQVGEVVNEVQRLTVASPFHAMRQWDIFGIQRIWIYVWYHFVPVGGAASAVPSTRPVAAHLRQLDPEGWGVEGVPGRETEGQRGGTGCLASHQARGSPHTGTGAGERDTTTRCCLMVGLSFNSTRSSHMNRLEPNCVHPSHWLLSFISKTPTLRNLYEITTLSRLSSVRWTTRSSFCSPGPCIRDKKST